MQVWRVTAGPRAKEPAEYGHPSLHGVGSKDRGASWWGQVRLLTEGRGSREEVAVRKGQEEEVSRRSALW